MSAVRVRSAFEHLFCVLLSGGVTGLGSISDNKLRSRLKETFSLTILCNGPRVGVHVNCGEPADMLDTEGEKFEKSGWS